MPRFVAALGLQQLLPRGVSNDTSFRAAAAGDAAAFCAVCAWNGLAAAAGLCWLSGWSGAGVGAGGERVPGGA